MCIQSKKTVKHEVIFQVEKREDLQAFVEVRGGTSYLLQAKIAQQNSSSTSGTLQAWIKVQIQVSLYFTRGHFFLNHALATSTGYVGRRPLPWLACNVARASLLM